MASVKRKCCCGCRCGGCPGVTMPAALDVVIAGANPCGCQTFNANSSQSFGNPNGTFLFTCATPQPDPQSCEFRTTAIPISSAFYAGQSTCGFPTQSFPLSSGRLSVSTAAGNALLRVFSSTSPPNENGHAFFDAVAPFTCQQILDGATFTDPRFCGLGEGAAGGTAFVKAHNPLP